ncbi:MAG: hypothetical protein HQL50_03165 [Magnetococcales bacterium]|nr:hypothetical protein [Magnetococcales bacterium]
MSRMSLGPYRIRKFLPWTFVLLILGISLILMAISYVVGTLQLRDSAESSMAQVGRAVLVKTGNYLDAASQVVRQNDVYINTILNDRSFLDDFQKMTRKQIDLFPYLGLIYYGDERGNHWLNKRERDGTVRMRTISRLNDSAASKAAIKRATALKKQDGYDQNALEKMIAPYLRTYWHYSDKQGNIVRKEQDHLKVYDTRMRDWYKGAAKNRSLFWSNVYTWEESYGGKTSLQVGITASNPVMKNGQLLGVTAVDILLADLSHFLKKLESTPNGRAFIINASGQTVGLKDFTQVIRQSAGKKKVELNHISQVSDRALVDAFASVRQELGLSSDRQRVQLPSTGQTLAYSSDGETHFGLFLPLPSKYGLDWVVGVVAPEKDFMGNMRRNMMFSAAISLVCIAVVIIVGFIISQKITTPLNALAEDAKKIADFDLSDSKPIDSMFQEIGFVSEVFTTMKNNLRSMMQEISHHADTLNGSSNQMSDISDSMQSRSEDMAEKAQHVTGAMHSMSTNMHSISSEIDGMSEQIRGSVYLAQEVNEGTDSISMTAIESGNRLSNVAMASQTSLGSVTEVQQSAERVSNNSDRVASSIQEVNVAFTQIRKQCEVASTESRKTRSHAENSSTVMLKLSSSAEEVGESVEVISKIAEQTNMLALNAAIEAARVGAAGLGFAVVANEVNDLANQTAKASQMIATKIDSIRVTTGEVSSVIGDMRDSFERIDTSNNEILQAVDTQSTTIQGVSAAMDDVTHETKEVSRLSGDLAMKMGEVNQDVQEVSNNMSDVTSKVTEASGQVSNMTENMNHLSASSDSIVQSVSESSKVAKATAEAMGQVNSSAGEIKTFSNSVGNSAKDMKGVARELSAILNRFTM